MSGEYANILKQRAESMIRLAERLLQEGEYDLAVLNAEYAAQLSIKSLLYRLTGEEWRGHSIRELLGSLAMVLKELRFTELSDHLVDYVRRNRMYLAELEEAHVRSVYGIYRYSKEQANTLVSFAKELMGLVSKVEGGVIER